jgi:hypothetical protein
MTKPIDMENRLGGAKDNFLRDAKLFGLSHAVKEFHLEDISFPWICDWAKRESDEIIHASRRMFTPPVEGDLNYMEDFLTVILKRFGQYEEKIARIQSENEQLRLAMTYHRTHPLEGCNELLAKIVGITGSKKDVGSDGSV